MKNQNKNQDYTQHYDTKIESVVLGAIIQESEAYYRVNQILKSDMFKSDYNRAVYRKIEDMHRESKPVDMVTLTMEFVKTKEVAANYIAELVDGVYSSSHIVQHALFIKQEYVKRQTMSVYQKSLSDLLTGVDIADVLTNSVKKLSEIEEGSVVNDTLKPIIEFAKASINEVEKRVSNSRNGVLNGVPTFSQQLDKITGGWQKSDLIVIAARPAMGKTAIALKALETAANYNFWPAMFALEMKGERLIDRLILERTGIEDWKYKQGKLTNEELISIQDTSNYLFNLKAHIDDNSSQTIYRIKSRCRILKKKGMLGMVIIDYLQLAESDSKKANTRNEEVAAMSRELKKMAKELDVPVIVLSQLNRCLESRSDKMPLLSDLRDSGAIEQDADMVCFIHRPEYYKMTLQDSEDNDIKNGIEFIIAKYREGATGSVYLQHDGTVKNIMDYSGDIPF